MTRPILSIRAASQDDLDWLVAEHGAVYAAEFGFDGRFQPSIAEKLASFVRQGGAFSRIWIGEVDNVRVASIAVSERPENAAFLNFVLVSAGARGKGLGRKMMETALDHARSNGMIEVRLETYSCLKAARRLYERFGFVLTETTPSVALYGQTFDREFWTLNL